MVHLKRAVAVRVSENEYAAIQKAAKKNGLVVSRWMREVCVAAAAGGAQIIGSVRFEQARRKPRRRR